MSIAEQRVKDIGLTLFGDDKKGIRSGLGTVPYTIHEDLLFVGGVEPLDPDGKPGFVGRLGKEFTAEEGYKAARLVGITMLSIIKDALGDLDRVDFFIKSTCLINGVAGYSDLARVADGFTDLMTEVFGERGMHARSDLGATNLNNNVPILCDALIKIRD
jgi:enamine deaminase RidA (YjgF/YER057c/UK114 family)